ncbi:hypothetical protein DBV15_00196 [Temnothorax longispinosus]|uniref:Uncharacterized protein n=1 Tax=Temnothorax longispinosus TaxID=300112 RepID=A0A4S2KDJ2_9HYME|nr:hypothetical protein DBV15_00196 [Temnothorax longispinosus]
MRRSVLWAANVICSLDMQSQRFSPWLKTATVAYQTSSRVESTRSREFRGRARSRNGNYIPESRLLFRALSRFAPREANLYERKKWEGRERRGEAEENGRSLERENWSGFSSLSRRNTKLDLSRSSRIRADSCARGSFKNEHEERSFLCGSSLRALASDLQTVGEKRAFEVTTLLLSTAGHAPL